MAHIYVLAPGLVVVREDFTQGLKGCHVQQPYIEDAELALDELLENPTGPVDPEDIPEVLFDALTKARPDAVLNA